MKTSRLALPLLLACTCLSPLPVLAQSDSNPSERMDHIEHDLMLLQRQVARGETPATGGGDTGAPITGGAQLEVRLSSIEEDVRDLRGKVEETQFQTRKLSDALDKLQRDVDFRFNEMGGAAGTAPGAPPGPAATAPGAPPAAGAPPAPDGGKPIDLTTKPPVKPLTEPTPAASPAAALPEKPPISITKAPSAQTENQVSVTDPAHPPVDPASNAPVSFPTPREHYNYAFRLLNQTQYDQAATAFESFTKKYPKDPLIGNAYYWEGETYYIRRDFVAAADFFRQGFESAPEGPKAADNLLKLAMSLDALGRDKESCVVLQQISAKFKKTASGAVQKAEAEQKRIACK